MGLMKEQPFKSCLYCGATYRKKTRLSFSAWQNSKYCSRSCMQSVNPGAAASAGKPSWNKGLKASAETRQRISQSQVGRVKSLESIEKQRQKMIGRKITWADKISKSNKGRPSLRGDKHPNWKGGKTPHLKKLRNSVAYSEWRTAVFQRDDYTCQMCGVRGVYLEADHIKPFAFFEDLRFDVGNGRTLCKPCHKTTDTYSKGALKYA